jgi:hypothetical protein
MNMTDKKLVSESKRSILRNLANFKSTRDISVKASISSKRIIKPVLARPTQKKLFTAKQPKSFKKTAIFEDR